MRVVLIDVMSTLTTYLPKKFSKKYFGHFVNVLNQKNFKFSVPGLDQQNGFIQYSEFARLMLHCGMEKNILIFHDQQPLSLH